MIIYNLPKSQDNLLKSNYDYTFIYPNISCSWSAATLVNFENTTHNNIYSCICNSGQNNYFSCPTIFCMTKTNNKLFNKVQIGKCTGSAYNYFCITKMFEYSNYYLLQHNSQMTDGGGGGGGCVWYEIKIKDFTNNSTVYNIFNYAGNSTSGSCGNYLMHLDRLNNCLYINNSRSGAVITSINMAGCDLNNIGFCEYGRVGCSGWFGIRTIERTFYPATNVTKKFYNDILKIIE